MDPLEVGKFLLILGSIAGIYISLHRALRTMTGKGESREISNTPLHVQETARPATLHDVERVEKRLSKVEREVIEMREASAKSRDKIYDELSDIRDRFGDKFDTLGDTLRQIERSLGRLEK